MTTQTTKDDSPSLWQVFRAELFEGPHFLRNTGDSAHDSDYENTSAADIEQRAFFPSGAKPLIAKVAMSGWIISTLILQFILSPYPLYEFAYLTNWSLMVTAIYMVLSLVACAVSTCSLSWATEQTSARLRTIFTGSISTFFVLAAAQELLVTLFWAKPDIEEGDLYVTLLAHGPFTILVLVDGFLINKIPVRARQIVFLWAFQGTYLAWTGIYSILDLMNPWVMTMNMDEGIYTGVLNWRLHPFITLAGAAAILFAITPVIFGFVWMLSYYARRSQSVQDDDGESKVADHSEAFTEDDTELADLEAGLDKEHGKAIFEDVTVTV